ncbi:MAG: putative urea ABC transporter substrate-binding protein [Rhodospirillales bacterium]
MRFDHSKRTFTKTLTAALVAVGLLATGLPGAAQAAEKTSFRIAWSIYVGWMPWAYASESGIMKKWADKYGIEVEIVQINDYIESINQYTAGAFDGCVMTNMDALTIPAAGGVDSTALIVGDFSNGNDGIVTKDSDSVKALKGKNVNLVELSVSHYLLARALDSVGLAEKDLTVVNTSDADIVSAFTSAPDVTSVVTWNPQLAEVKKVKGAAAVFDSSQIPGEIIDMMVVNSETLAANPKLGKALTGAWYEIMGIMSSDTKEGKAARSMMATAAGTDLAGYDFQLGTTKMFYTPAEAVTFTTSDQLPATMKKVSEFSFAHGLLGDGAPNAEVIGMTFPGGKTWGDAGNVKLRFDDSFMAMAKDGKL